MNTDQENPVSAFVTPNLDFYTTWSKVAKRSKVGLCTLLAPSIIFDGQPMSSFIDGLYAGRINDNENRLLISVKNGNVTGVIETDVLFIGPMFYLLNCPIYSSYDNWVEGHGFIEPVSQACDLT
jgi:hypothetical protein